MRKECPKCESFYQGDRPCPRCEEEFTFKFGLEASRAKKAEQEALKWKVKPDGINCGEKE